MRKKLLLILGAVLTLTVLSGVAYAFRPKTPVNASKTVQTVSPPTVEELFSYTNAARAKAGVKPLTLDQRLNQSAQRKADEMEATGKYEHFNEAGQQGYTYVFDTVPSCKYASENLNNHAQQYPSKVHVASWLNSTRHREALLDDRYELVGFSVTDNYIVQHFCDID